MLRKIAFIISLFFLPAFAFAQPAADFGGIGQTVNSVISFINNYLVPLVFAAAFIMFIWGMFKFFILGGSSSESQGEGKQLMLWSVVAFVMMISIWGLVNVVAKGLGFNKSSSEIVLPTAPTTRGGGGR